MITHRDIIELPRRGGGKPHTLIQYDINNDKYIFCTAESWCPVQITGTMDNITAVDSDGGPMIGVGSEINGRTVKKIGYEEGIGFIIEF